MASEEEISDFEEENQVTLVQVNPRKAEASPRPRSAGVKKGQKGKKGYNSVGGPYGTSSGRNSRQSTSKSLKEGGASTGTKKSTQQENWTNTLRHTGQGYTALSSNMNSFSGLKKMQTANMGYSSTSHFLRQTVGTEKTSKIKIEKGKAAPGTPAYKSQEEYYDQILELKKQIQALNQENSNIKSKVGRLEKDNIKKEKEIEQLLDPSKSEEMRRTLADRKPDAGAVMHSLKQKILKLEKQLKEKEAEFNKLQSDIKTTKIEELRMQMEAYYSEVLRLTQLKTVNSSGQRNSGSATVKESPSKMKALQDTILKMNEKNYHLQMENKSLKEDLDKQLENHKASKDLQAEYQDMNKKELLTTITKLEKRLDKAEEATSLMSEVESRSGVIEGKISLQGTAAQRLDLLDKRETELLDELKKKNDQLKKLKEDRAHYRKKCEERDKQITALKKEADDLHAELDGFYDKDKSRVTPRVSPRRKGGSSVNNKKVEDFRQKHAAKTIQKNWRNHKQSSQDQDEINRRIEHFRKNHAAKSIQKEWRGYKSQKQGQDEAAELIQAYLRAHQTRSRTLKSGKQNRNNYPDEEDTEDTYSETQSDMTLENTGTLASLYKGQLNRADQGRSTRKSDIRPVSSKGSSRGYGKQLLDSAGESEESDDLKSNTLGNSFSGRASVTSGHSAPSKYSSNSKQRGRSPQQTILSEDDDDDSDDDIVMPKGKKLF